MTIACLEYKKYVRRNILNTKHCVLRSFIVERGEAFLNIYIFQSLLHYCSNLANFNIENVMYTSVGDDRL